MDDGHWISHQNLHVMMILGARHSTAENHCAMVTLSMVLYLLLAKVRGCVHDLENDWTSVLLL